MGAGFHLLETMVYIVSGLVLSLLSTVLLCPVVMGVEVAKVPHSATKFNFLYVVQKPWETSYSCFIETIFTVGREQLSDSYKIDVAI